ncbi:MAG: NTP transferase domain-containing protein [Clostridia bacterium]|nr:NTP transferase domain-containing protein [Clostridia bacterium]
MAMQAIIMAGGEGMRLRPLTAHIPKPLCPLLDEPVMGYAINLLKRHGVSEIGVTLWYQPQKIRRVFHRGERYGVKLKYYEEKEPVGTAGSIKMARKALTDTFFVLSGDGLTDCDLSAALRFHKEKKALATLVLKRVSVPLTYGVVLTDGDSRVTRFIEKPDWKRVFSDLVNTGVYILEPEIFDYIPDTGAPDFGKDIFPALLAGGLPVYGYETDAYWCDVGDQRAYLQAQKDLLAGMVSLPHASGIHENAQVDAGAKIEGSCFICEDAVIGPGAIIRDSVIGRSAIIGPGAVVENSCLWQDVTVQEKARISGSVLCDGAAVRQGAELSDGCALGQRAAVGAYALLRPGVKVWPHFRVAPGAVTAHNVVSGDLSAPLWTSGGAAFDTAEGACGLCGAYARVTGARQVAVGGSTAALETLAAGALGAAGVQTVMIGEATEPMLSTVIRALRLDGGVFAGRQTLLFLDKKGFPLPPKQTNAIDACVLRQDMPPAFAHPVPIRRFQGAEDVYLAFVLPPEASRPLFSPIAVFSDSSFILKLAEAGLRRMGARDARFAPVTETELRQAETGFMISSDGKEITVFTVSHTLTHEQKTMLLLALLYQKTGRLYDLPGVPRAAESIAPLSLPDSEKDCFFQQAILCDGLASLFLIADTLRNGPLETLLQSLPETHISVRDIVCGVRDKGRILHSLCGQTSLPHTLGEGVRIRHENGYATIVPDAHRNLVRVTSESVNSEFAQELCDFYFDQIQKITAQNKKTPPAGEAK